MIRYDTGLSKVNGQRTVLPGESEASPPDAGDRFATVVGSPLASGPAGEVRSQSRVRSALELTEIKHLVGRNGEEKYLWRVVPRGEGHLPSRWVQPGRGMIRSLEEAWSPYGWNPLSPGDQRDVQRELAAQARGLRPGVVFEVPGWQRYDDQWVFVHAGGAIAAGGAVPGVEARLQPPFDSYRLPAPSVSPEQRREAALGALLPLAMGLPLGAMVPLWCALWLPPLQPFLPLDLTIFLHGGTGGFKTSLLRVLLAAWGCPADSQAHFLPYASTTRALEELLARARHLPVVIDDVVRQTPRQDEARLATILRKVGSGEPRWTFQGGGEPRGLGFEGLLYMAGESPPQLPSLRARAWLIPTDRYRLSSTSLEQLEKEAIRTGLLSRAVADYLAHIAEHWDTLQRELPQRYERARPRGAGTALHPRRAGDPAGQADPAGQQDGPRTRDLPVP